MIVGYLKIDICDENGTPLDGYSTDRLFKSSTNRPCNFEKPLKEHCGK